jgi:hypothetical protein
VHTSTEEVGKKTMNEKSTNLILKNGNKKSGKKGKMNMHIHKNF